MWKIRPGLLECLLLLLFRGGYSLALFWDGPCASCCSQWKEDTQQGCRKSKCLSLKSKQSSTKVAIPSARHRGSKVGNPWKCSGKCSRACSRKLVCSGGVLPRVLREIGCALGSAPESALPVKAPQEEHSREHSLVHPQSLWALSGAPPRAPQFPGARSGALPRALPQGFPTSDPLCLADGIATPRHECRSMLHYVGVPAQRSMWLCWALGQQGLQLLRPRLQCVFSVVFFWSTSAFAVAVLLALLGIACMQLLL